MAIPLDSRCNTRLLEKMKKMKVLYKPDDNMTQAVSKMTAKGQLWSRRDN